MDVEVTELSGKRVVVNSNIFRLDTAIFIEGQRDLKADFRFYKLVGQVFGAILCQYAIPHAMKEPVGFWRWFFSCLIKL